MGSRRVAQRLDGACREARPQRRIASITAPNSTTTLKTRTPSTIASAVYSGHKFGGGLGLAVDDPALNIRRESPCWRTIPVHWARC